MEHMEGRDAKEPVFRVLDLDPSRGKPRLLCMAAWWIRWLGATLSA